MRLPSFLIIGAARCGTTTLYRDLMTHPDVFFPIDKEPGNLLSDDVLTEEGRRKYASLFSKAQDQHICGEATTLYTHRPDYGGVPERAKQVLGEELKCVYIVRNPIDKIVSTHHLYVSLGWVSPDINRAVREYPPLLNHARYAMQLEPWLETFGKGQIRVLRFETYIRRRKEIIADLESFLGLEPRPDLVRAGRIFNQSSSGTMPAGPFAALIRNRFYRRWVRPLLSAEMRTSVRRLLLPPMPQRPEPPNEETVTYIVERLAEDLERQQAVLGTAGNSWPHKGTP